MLTIPTPPTPPSRVARRLATWHEEHIDAALIDGACTACISDAAYLGIDLTRRPLVSVHGATYTGVGLR